MKKTLRKTRIIFLITTFAIALIIIPSIIDNQNNLKYPIDNKCAFDNKNAIEDSSTSYSHTYEWNRTSGGSEDDVSNGVAVDSLDNVYLSGFTGSFGAGGGDMVLAKYDSSGVQLWNRTWGGSEADVSNGVAVDSADNIYITGYTESSGAGRQDMVLVKYDSSGVEQWYRTWGGNYWDIGRGIAVDSSDNVYISGYTDSFGIPMDMVLVKYDNSGVQLWNRTWGGNNGDEGFGVAVDSSDNVYLAGRTLSTGAGLDDLVLVKYDSSGVEQWYRTWGGGNYDYCTGVIVDSSDKIYLVGFSDGFGVGIDMVLVKYDNYGVQLWNRTWGGNGHDYGYGLAVDSLDNVYLSGFTGSFGAGGGDMVLVKYDSSGMEQWNHTWGGSKGDVSHGVAVDSADNIYMTGVTRSFGAGGGDMVLVKFSIISIINIITPQNTIYSGPMSGYYPATYGFECDKDGADPKGWLIESETPNALVISELDGHKKVLRLDDDTSGSGLTTRVYNNFSKKDFGTIEVWIRQNSLGHINRRGQITGMGGDTMLFGVRMWGGTTPTWKARDNGTEVDIIGAPIPLASTWYHIRIDFEHTSGGYQGLSKNEYYIYIDGSQYGPFRFDVDEQVEELHLHTYSYGSSYRVYFDAVGYSWDPNYKIGDNHYEGLLLSFETISDLDWCGYSLDSQNFVTIMGNSTISMPEDGPHTIQVIGNEVLGKKHQSEIRHFTIDTKIPEFMINSPIPDGFYRVVPPEFNITIIEENLASTWYTLDGGTTNITFSGLTGIINQIEWDKKGTGIVNIRFYANDIIGRVGYAEVSVFKDIDNPLITINEPSQDEKFGDTAPNYDISILEPNLESIWYTLDGGINNYTIYQYTGTINQAAWEAAPYSIITIRFYAKDLAGNIDYKEVVVEKIEEFPWELIILISSISGGVVIGVAIILIIRRKRKRI